MAKLYVQLRDLEKCQRSLRSKIAVRITGLHGNGKVIALRGVVQSLESGCTVFPGYPLRVTIPDVD